MKAGEKKSKKRQYEFSKIEKGNREKLKAYFTFCM